VLIDCDNTKTKATHFSWQNIKKIGLGALGFAKENWIFICSGFLSINTEFKKRRGISRIIPAH
jgi:hypothetical protein